MVLKSYRLKTMKRSKNKTRKTKPTKDLITGGVTALVGTAFVVETANVLGRL